MEFPKSALHTGNTDIVVGYYDEEVHLVMLPK